MQLVYMGQKRPKTIWVVSGLDHSLALQQAKYENHREKGDFKPLKNISVLKCDSVQERTEIVFEPFKAVEVVDTIARLLLKSCADIIFEVGKAERKREQKPDHNPSTNGYVGDSHADQIPDLEKQMELDKKNDEGMSPEELIEKSKKKSRDTGKKKEIK